VRAVNLKLDDGHKATVEMKAQGALLIE